MIHGVKTATQRQDVILIACVRQLAQMARAAAGERPPACPSASQQPSWAWTPQLFCAGSTGSVRQEATPPSGTEASWTSSARWLETDRLRVPPSPSWPGVPSLWTSVPWGDAGEGCGRPRRRRGGFGLMPAATYTAGERAEPLVAPSGRGELPARQRQLSRAVISVGRRQVWSRAAVHAVLGLESPGNGPDENGAPAATGTPFNTQTKEMRNANSN